MTRAAKSAALVSFKELLLLKRSAIRALRHPGVTFVRSHGNLIQRTIIFRAAMILALCDCTLNTMIRVLLVHTEPSFQNRKHVYRAPFQSGVFHIRHEQTISGGDFMKQKKRTTESAVSFNAFPQSGTFGCERRLSSESSNGITRSRGISEKDPTVHPETPRNNPNSV